MTNISIITPSCNAKALTACLYCVSKQQVSGLSSEIIVIQESNDGFSDFINLTYGSNFTIIRQPLSYDCGAKARDVGLLAATGDYVVFWDDDNIYYDYALAVMFSITNGFDIGIAKTKFAGTTIPTSKTIKAGNIDTMCFCVKKEIAAKVKWVDYGGRYSDFRWISKITALSDKINFSPIIIGEKC